MRACFQLSLETVFFCGVPPLGHHFSECFRCCLNDASDDMSSVPYFPDGHKSTRRWAKICDGITFHLRKRVNYFRCKLEYLVLMECHAVFVYNGLYEFKVCMSSQQSIYLESVNENYSGCNFLII